VPIRIVGGAAGGRRLKGAPRTGMRPTTGRVREAIFDMLESRDVDYSAVLDLYAGTGALGIEAMSRGEDDSTCDFVEADSKTCEVIRRNLTATMLLDRGRVFPLQVAKAFSRLKGPYTLVVADPPYEYDRAQADVAGVIERGLLADDGILVVEHSKRHEWPEELAGRRQIAHKRYGDTCVTMYGGMLPAHTARDG
jgi:16S rRNA (guanine966-N2)-methyltransferase